MALKSALIAAVLLLFFHQSFGQRNYEGYNFLGITGGFTIFDIQTSDLEIKPGNGFIAGFTTRGAFRNDFDLVYGISFQSSKLGVEGRAPMGGRSREIEYAIQGVQINFLGSYNIIVKHLSLEFGPVFNINGKMKLDRSEYGGYILEGYETTTAKDIENISKFDLRLAGGITAGLEHFRLNAQYHYGATNILAGLNDNQLENDNFKGNSSTFILAAVIYF